MSNMSLSKQWEENKENMRRPLLLYKTLTDTI